MPPPAHWIAIAIGGAVGSLLRYALFVAAVAVPGGSSIAGTLAANLIGCFAIGWLMGVVFQHPEWMNESAAIGLRIGVLGGLTTFSTFAAESTGLLSQGRIIAAVAYIASSVLLGIVAVFAGGWFATPTELAT